MGEEKLRFAPLIRVSTEKQEQKGESLLTQKKQIEEYVQRIGGTIPDHCWKYSGQEHATADSERKILDKLLCDSTNDFFDAVIVCDASRWSRDNIKSEEGINILKKNGIRFFTIGKEYDLFNPNDRLFLSVQTVLNAYQAAEQTRKSILNRLERAKRNIPTTGKLPFGRTYDKETGIWDVDPTKRKTIEIAAEMYLNGASSDLISKTCGMNWPNLLKTMKYRSGTEWPNRFRKKECGIDETVILKIPRLLPEETIDKIKEKAKANKTYSHGKIKHNYLLSRIIFCQNCGLALGGQTNHSGKRYYRHYKRNKDENCISYVPADDIEQAVLTHLFRVFGDVANIENAIAKAIPDATKINEFENQAVYLTKRLSDIKLGRNRILDKVKKDLITDEEIESEMIESRKQQQEISAQLASIKMKIQDIPSKLKQRNSARTIKGMIQRLYRRSSHVRSMSYNDRKELMQTVLGGVDIDGKRFGVYLKSIDIGSKKRISYDIHGNFRSIKSYLPLTLEEFIATYGIEIDRSIDTTSFKKLVEEYESFKLDSVSKRHAYYSFRFHQR